MITNDAISSMSAASAGGIGWRCPHAWEMSQPCAAISRAPVLATMLLISGRSAIAMTRS